MQVTLTHLTQAHSRVCIIPGTTPVLTSSVATRPLACYLLLNVTKLAGGITTDHLDEILAELEVDPLDALIAELDRIERHETMLHDAVANNKAVVVHPRPEVRQIRDSVSFCCMFTKQAMHYIYGLMDWLIHSSLAGVS